LCLGCNSSIRKPNEPQLKELNLQDPEADSRTFLIQATQPRPLTLFQLSPTSIIGGKAPNRSRSGKIYEIRLPRSTANAREAYKCSFDSTRFEDPNIPQHSMYLRPGHEQRELLQLKITRSSRTPSPSTLEPSANLRRSVEGIPSPLTRTVLTRVSARSGFDVYFYQIPTLSTHKTRTAHRSLCRERRRSFPGISYSTPGPQPSHPCTIGAPHSRYSAAARQFACVNFHLPCYLVPEPLGRVGYYLLFAAPMSHYGLCETGCESDVHKTKFRLNNKQT